MDLAELIAGASLGIILLIIAISYIYFKKAQEDSEQNNKLKNGNGSIGAATSIEEVNSTLIDIDGNKKEALISSGEVDYASANSSIRYETGKSSTFKREIQKKYNIDALYHMTDEKNIANILEHGILSHNEAYTRCLINYDISDGDVQNRREAKVDPCYGKNLHDYASLYINPRNPMLYRRKEHQSRILIVEVDIDVLSKFKFLITDGNAASNTTKFYNNIDGFNNVSWDVINSKYWNDKNDGKRKMCAEVLVFPLIPPEFIKCLHCLQLPLEKVDLSNQIQIAKSPRFYFERY